MYTTLPLLSIMEPTQEEFDKMFLFFEQRMCYKYLYENMNSQQKKEFINQEVLKHFTLFLNQSEQNAIKELILNNFKENHGYKDDIDNIDHNNNKYVLPTGYLMCWEIQVVVSHFNKFISKDHMNTWYSQEYYNQLASIIKSKKL